MAKTVFDDTPPLGTIVTAAFLNLIFNHRHDGLDADGSCPIDYAASTGSNNAYVVALSPALTAHIAGMPIFFKANFTNNGAATININGLGAIAIKKNTNVALGAGDIVSGQIVEVAYDGTYYQMISNSNPSLLYAASTGSNNAYVVALSPALTAHVAGMPIRFKANFTNTGAATVNFNGLGAVALKKKGNVALASGDIVSGQIVEVEYDGTNYQMVTSAQVIDASQYSVLSNQNGKAEIRPSGVIEQWGYIDFGSTVDEGLQGPYSFPMEFPNAFENIQITTVTPEYSGHGDGGDGIIEISNSNKPTKTQFYVWVNELYNNGGARGFYWRAIGN